MSQPTRSVTRRSFVAAAFALAALAPFGCAPAGGANVHGTLLWKGKEYKAPANDFVEVVFVSDGVEKGVLSFSAEYDPATGGFRFANGLPAGKYQVRVRHEAGEQGQDRLQNAFNESSPLTYEVTAEPDQALAVDLGARTVTRK